MFAYILRRLLLIIPTLLGIMVINFVVIQFAPGGPVEQVLAELRGNATDSTSAFSGQAGDIDNAGQNSTGLQTGTTSKYRGAQGLDPSIIAEIEQQFGFDKPVHERFFTMLADYARFDFGSSYFRDETVINLVLDKMPVSISLGLWTTLFVYLISIPLGIKKAVKDGSPFDVWSSGAIVVGYAIPGFLFAILLIILFAGGRSTHPRLLLAYHPPGYCYGYQRICQLDHADKKFIPGSNRHAVRSDSQGEGSKRRTCSVRARIQKCDADCHCRISERIYFYFIHRLHTD